MKTVILFVAAFFFSIQGYCASAPTPCGADTRVRCVKYDPFDVVPVTTTPGYHTLILFSRDEKIIDIGSGDITAWDIGMLEDQYGFFIKPKLEKPETNITVVTNLRDYHFDFRVLNFRKAEQRIYKVQFLYPQDEAKAKSAITEKLGTEKLLAKASIEKIKNEDYWVEGSPALTPSIAWDDGNFTYLRFPPNTDLPAVYYVADDGTENKVNRHVPEPNTIALQVVAKKLVLRRDNLVSCIYNESYDKYGIENSSMTISPLVNRVVRKPTQNKGKRTVITEPVPSSPISFSTLNANPLVQEVTQANSNVTHVAPFDGVTTVDISKPDSRFLSSSTSRK